MVARLGARTAHLRSRCRLAPRNEGQTADRLEESTKNEPETKELERTGIDRANRHFIPVWQLDNPRNIYVIYHPFTSTVI